MFSRAGRKSKVKNNKNLGLPSRQAEAAAQNKDPPRRRQGLEKVQSVFRPTPVAGRKKTTKQHVEMVRRARRGLGAGGEVTLSRRRRRGREEGGAGGQGEREMKHLECIMQGCQSGGRGAGGVSP